jgi:hypothetical protein
MSTQKIIYKGKEITCIDPRGVEGPDVIARRLADGCRIITQSPAKVAVLVNFQGVVVSQELTEELKKWAPQIGPHLTKLAVLISSPLQNVLLSSFNLAMAQAAQAFSSEEKAKDWLIN